METIDQRIAALTPHLKIFRPDGPGPFPAVFQLHGCGGPAAFQLRYAEVARRAGWAAIVIDSFAHRGIGRAAAYATVCMGLRLWGRERAGDWYAMLEWARRQEWIDARRLVGAGWSHGGWTVLDGMALAPGREARAATKLEGLPEEPLAGVVGAFLVYPYQGPGALAPRKGLRIDVRPLAIVGTRDVVVGSGALERTLQGIKTPGAPIRIERFETATHAFDEPNARDLRVRYDETLVRRAEALYADYLTAR